MNVTLPNGVTIRGVPDDATKDQIKAKAIKAGLAKEEDFAAPSPGRSIGQEALRTLGRGARYGIEGISAIPNLLTQPIVSATNAATDALGVNRIFQPSQSQALSGFLSDLGLPEDETAGERVTGDVVRALTAGGGVLGAAQRLEGPIAAALSKAPTLQAMGETAGATSAGVARESGVGPWGQIGAGFLGGMLAPMTAQTALAGGRTLLSGARGATDTARQLAGQRTPGMVEEFAGTQLPREAQRRLRSAERLGEQITPAEAVGDPILAARQGASGTSEAGARKLVDFGEERLGRQGETIGKLLDDLSPSEASAAIPIRETARKILRDQQDALSKQAAPLYKKAFKTSLPDEAAQQLSSDPILSAAAQKVQSNPIYKKALEGSSTKDLKFWDLVKRDIDDQIEAAVRAGERNKSRLLQDSKRTLTSTLDEASSDYVAARAIYGEGARPLQELREGVVGRIAGLEDSQLKRVSKILFDTTETDPQVLNQVRKQFIKESPDAWKSVIRNEIERRLDSVKGDRTGSTFYNTILSKDRDFRMFLNATRGMPDVQRTLIDMRRVWKDLINPESVKGAAGKAKSSLDVPRSSAEAIANFVKNRLGSQADKAAVELITSPDWADEVKRIASIKSQPRRETALLEAIAQVATASTTGAAIGTAASAP